MRAINRGFFISAAISAAAVFVDQRWSHGRSGGRAAAVLIGLILASRDPDPDAVLHRHEVQARAGDRGVDRDGSRDHDPVRVLRSASSRRSGRRC